MSENTDLISKYCFDYVPNKNIPGQLKAYIWMIIRRNPIMWACMIFMDVLHGLRYPIAFLFVGRIVDLLLSMDGATAIPLLVWQYIGVIFLVLLVGELAHLGPHYVIFNWVKRARAQLRADMLAYVMDHSFTYFQDQFAGALSRKITEGIEKIPDLQNGIRWDFFLPLVAMGSSGIVLFGVSYIYGWIVLVFVAAILLPVLLKLKKLREKSRIFADQRSLVSGQIVDTLSNIAAVKSYGHEKAELEQHRKVSEGEMKAWHKMLRVFLMLDNYRRMTLVLFGGGMMSACVVGWQYGLVTPGDIATIMGVSYGFTANAWRMSFGIIHISEALGYLNDSLQTLIRPIQVHDRKDAKELIVERAHVRFDHIRFEYENQAVFEDLYLDILPAERIGLVGKSGAGKTTLIHLLQRFFDVQDGCVLVDGQDVRKVTQESLRRNIAVIPQDTALFHRTLMDNIRYGNLLASDEAVFEAARRAYADEFIQDLPQGYDTIVGERGVKLSGGQRQRIAIARAILKDAPILILDEATSALDSESEKYIQESLKDLMVGKTVIAIAHRLSTLSHLDRLIVMDQGRIIEDGTHDELFGRDGLYAKLWSMQSGGFLGE